MSEQLIGLVDANNFYVSAERCFQPHLEGRPVIVTSNNDGCAVARSNEAKALGIKMGEPVFKIRDLIREHGVIVLSSNYTLYGDMSSRLMSVLRDMAPGQEIYSIDESFLDLTGIPSPVAHGQMIRQRVREWLGLPVCVGMAPTKTLAKLANHIAKKNPEWEGVCNLAALPQADHDAWLARVEVGEVWGVGRRIAPRLQEMGIHSVRDLRDAHPPTIRKHFGVVLERTVRELRGESCLAIEAAPSAQKQIMCSRSFGQEIDRPEEVQQALTEFITRAGVKLRRQQLQATQAMLFVMSNPFGPDPQRGGQVVVPFLEPTDDPIIFGRAAALATRSLYRPGVRYKKAGAMLMNLVPAGTGQPDLFGGVGGEEEAGIAGVMDAVNRKFGRGSLRLGASVGRKRWAMRAENRSPPFTTDWDRLPVAR